MKGNVSDVCFCFLEKVCDISLVIISRENSRCKKNLDTEKKRFANVSPTPTPHLPYPPPPACRLRFYQSSHSFLTHTHAWTCRQKLENPVPLLESEWFGTPSRPRSVKPTAGRNWSQVSEAWVRKWGATREPWLSGSTGLCWLFGDQQLICLWKTFPSASNSNDLKWITAASPAFWGSWGWERD